MLKNKQIKSILALVLVLAMAIGLASCAGTTDETTTAAPAETTTAAPTTEGEEPTETEAPTDDEIIIGFNNGSVTVDFLRMVGESIEEVCAREGIKLVVTESNFDVEQILPNVDNLLAQGADIIIDFNVNAEVGGNLVDYCGEKGVPVIGIDVVYPAPSGDVSWFFGANNQMAGEVCGEGLAEAAKERWDGEVEHLVLF